MLLALGSVTTYFSKQWNTFIDNLGLFTVIGVVLYFILRKAVEHRFNLKLESLKLDHQKVMFNFETYSTKQNERYPQMYYLTEHALGEITSLKGYKSFPTFENDVIEDVKTYCEKLEMNVGDINRILSLWEHEKEYAISEIHRLKKAIDYNRAEIKWKDANNYLIENELYFSDDVANQTRELLGLMYEYWLNLNPEYLNPIFRDDLVQMNKDNSVLKQRIDEQRKVWKAIMKKAVFGQGLLG